MTCGKAQEFLAQAKVDIETLVDAKKERLGPKEALAIARQASTIYVSKGKKTVVVDMVKAAPTEEELLKLLLGPSGNLRAPTLRKGKTLIVGFDADSFQKILGSKKST